MRGELSVDRAALALDALRIWPIERVHHANLVHRAFELRENYSAYDAIYVALAEVLDVTIVTLDGRLSRAQGIATVRIRDLTP